MNENAPPRMIMRELERLIESLHMSPSEELRQRLTEMAMKSSNEEGSMGRSSLEQGMQRVIAKVESQLTKVKDSHDGRSVQQCKELMERFADNHSISYKSEILTMLTTLSQLSKEDEEDVPMMLRPIRYGNFSISQQIKINSQPLNEAIRPREDERVIKSRKDIFQGVTEQQIVKELLYVFTNSKNKEQEYQLRRNVEASRTVRRMVSHIADLGWLHNKIISTKQREGMIVKSLSEAMHAQLQQFYVWNSNLELLTRENRLSLRKLYVKSFLPQLVLIWLATILEAVEPFNGCEIISIVNSYRPNGSEAVNSLINRILCIIIQPLLRYIHNWMYMGVLCDPYKEFFITENEDVSECEEWKKRFTLIKEMIPNILNEEAAIMILNIGKSISFLSNKCKVYYDIKVPFIEEQQIKEYISRGFYSFKGDFMKWLSEVYTEVNHVLLRTLFDEFHLKYHFQSMKHFYLMDKGDFCQQLYDVLKIQLQMEEEMSLHKLDAIISDTAIKCFNDFKLPNSSEYYRKSVVDRLLAKMIKYEGGNNIWDFINFQYSLQRIELLRSFFSPSIMENYERIFSFLWKLKQITEMLKDLWVLQSKQASKIRKLKNNELNEMHHKAYLLRNTMNHFMTNLHGYLMVAIESSWKKFDEVINSITNFDDILNIHKNFQLEILEITFNTASEQPTKAIIIDIFAAINTFRIIYQRLQENIEGYHDICRTKEERTSLSKRSMMSESRGISSYHFEDSHKEIVEISGSFNRIFEKFYGQICQKKGSDRSSLLARLNFSQYYFNDQLDDELEMI